MTVNFEMAIILRYFTELGNFRGATCPTLIRASDCYFAPFHTHGTQFLVQFYNSILTLKENDSTICVNIAKPLQNRPLGQLHLIPKLACLNYVTVNLCIL